MPDYEKMYFALAARAADAIDLLLRDDAERALEVLIAALLAAEEMYCETHDAPPGSL